MSPSVRSYLTVHMSMWSPECCCYLHLRCVYLFTFYYFFLSLSFVCILLCCLISSSYFLSLSLYQFTSLYLYSFNPFINLLFYKCLLYSISHSTYLFTSLYTFSNYLSISLSVFLSLSGYLIHKGQCVSVCVSVCSL